MVTRECRICGTNFEAKKHNHVMCSKECRMEHDRRRRRKPLEEHKHWNKTCVICNKQFETTKHAQKTCSLDCRQIHRKNESRQYNKEYWIKNKEKEYARKRKWDADNPEKLKEGKRRRYKVYSSCPKWRKKQAERLKAYGQTTVGRERKRAYNQRPEVRERRKKYDAQPERRKRKTELDKKYIQSEKGKQTLKKLYSRTDFIIKNRMRSSIHRQLNKRGLAKTSKTMDFLGYTVQDLIKHLESQFTDGMSWDNIGEWHIDHIRPVSSFHIIDMFCEENKRCWALNNLQPLWAKDNLTKGNKWDGVVNA